MRRITAQLRREGVLVNHKAVARHMREMGLAGICPSPNLSKRMHQAGIYPYLLRDVRAERPNHVWGIELTLCSPSTNTRSKSQLYGESM